MKIINNKHTTVIYLEKKHGKLLRATLKKIKELKYIDVNFVQNRFIVKYALNQYHKTKIVNAFNTDETKKDTISGFKGCSISGFGFYWL